MTTPAPSLKALAEAKTEGISKLTIFNVDPHLVRLEEGWNGRDEGPDLTEYRQRLKAAMKAGAFVPPIDVQMVDGQPVVRDGHSRTLMARELVDEGVPYVLQARQIRGDDAEMRYHMLGSAAGRPLSPLEQGRQFALLMRYGQSVAAIAARLGQHRSTVENGLKLAEMPSDVQAMVGNGQVASHTALKTVKAHGQAAATKLTEALITSGKKKVTAKVLAPVPTPVRGQTLPPHPKGWDQLVPARMPSPGIMEYQSDVFVAFDPSDDCSSIIGAARTLAQAQAMQTDSANRTISGISPLFDLVKRIAAINIIVSNLDRAAITQIVQDARALVGEQ